MSTKGLNQAQIDLVLSNGEVTASEIAEAATLNRVTKKKSILTVEQQKQLLSSKAITTEKLAEISATLGLETAEGGSLISKKTLNAEMVKQQLESIGIVGSTQIQIMSMLKLTTAEVGTAKASNILSGAMAKLNIVMSTNPIGAIITVIGIAIAGVYGLSKAFNALTDSAEEIDKRVDSLVDKYNELKTTADNNASTVESLADEYEELSKGVNNLGENVSLTSEEYDRYNEIVNQIADMFPTLIKGYTDEGTAILSLKGNVEQLRDAYKEAQQEAYNLLIATGKDSDGNDIMESYKNLSELDWWDSSIGAKDVTTMVKRDITKQILDLMSNMDTAVEEYDKLAQHIFDTYGSKGYNFLEEMGLPAIKDIFSKTSGITKEDLIAGRATVQSYYQGFQSEIDAKLSKVRLVANAFLNTNDFYLDDSTSDELKNALSVMINSLDEELANSFNGEKEKVGAYVNNIINSIKDNDEAQKALINLFTMDTTDMSVNDIQSTVDSYISTIATAIGEDPVELKIRLGFDEYDDIAYNYQKILNNAAKRASGATDGEIINERGKYKDYQEIYDKIDAFANEYSINTQDEIAAFQDALEKANYDTDKAFEYYLERSQFHHDVSFSDIFALKDSKGELNDLGKINEEIDKFQSAYKGLKEAMDSYNETGTFTLDQVQEIVSYGGDYLKYLMDENGNLQLNEKALNNVAIARINEMRAKALSNLMDNLDKITNEEQALSYLETQLLDTATGYDTLTASRIKAWSENALENGISQETIDKVTKSFKNQASAINEMFNNISLDSIYKSSSSSATKDAEQATKDYIDSYMNYMEKSLESGRIDYQTYSRDVAKFLKDMYDQGKIAAKDYHDYTKQMLEVEKSIYDKAISGIVYILDQEIDRLDEEKELIESNYQAKIDAIQSEIDALNEANDQRKTAMELEEAEYNLQRALNQKTQKVYDGEQFVYTADSSAIRDAEDEVAQRKNDMKISQLESQIKALEDAMKSETKAIDDQIAKYEEYKKQIQDVADAYENAENVKYALAVTGLNSEAEILQCRVDVLNDFKDEYISIQQAIAEAAWASANEQVKAAQDAAGKLKTIQGNNEGYKAYIGDELIGTYSTKQLAEFAAKNEVERRAEDEAKKAADKDGGRNASYIYELTKNGIGSQLLKKIRIEEYASGTKNAKPGWHKVSEKEYGDEIILTNDGNAVIAKGEQLYPFEGGEPVIKASETKKILDNIGNLEPIETNDLWKKLSGNMSDLSSMVKIDVPNYSKLNNMIIKNIIQQPSIVIGDIHLHEVQNVPDFAKALQKYLPNISVQYNGKH